MNRTRWTLIGVLALLVAFSFAAPPVHAGSGPTVISVFGKGAGGLLVHAWVLVPAGADANEVAREALASQGARRITSAEFTATGLVWDQFSDSDPTNDRVTQYYNPGSRSTQPEPVAATALVLATQAAWSDVAASTFLFESGGITTRCPSLVQECRGRQKTDGNNDIAWLKLSGCCTLGVTWFDTVRDEADMARNTNFSWDVSGGDYDVESVLLHENGHVVGLGHSDVETAVMFASYHGVNRVLDPDDAAGVVALYPLLLQVTGSVSGTVTDTAGVAIGGATVSTDTGQSGLTAVDGSYLIGDVTVGDRTITASASGYSSGSRIVTVADGVTTSGADFSLAEAEVATNVVVQSVSYATGGGRNGGKDLLVTVTMVDNTNAAVSGASVSIDLFRNGVLDGRGTGTTGTTGSVTFKRKNAPSGSYKTKVTAVSAASLTWDGVTPTNSFIK